MRMGWPSLVFMVGSSVKVMGTSDFRDKGCGDEGSEAGQIGDRDFLSVVKTSDFPVEGVREGTQKFDWPRLVAANFCQPLH
jgi:hypothetical protein